MAYNTDGTKTALFLDLSLQNPDNDGTALTFIRSTTEPSLSLVKDVNTIPNGIAMNPTGLAYDNGTTITSTSWDDLSTRIAQLSAVAPNGLNATLLAVNQSISIQNADTAPTRVINTDAGDTANVGEHFGVAWVGNTLPFVMETLDATNLRIKDTSLELYDTITPLLTTMTATGITTGVQSASWSSIIAGGGGVPSIDQVLAVGQNANNQPITNLNGIALASGTTLYNSDLVLASGTGSITGLTTINGVGYNAYTPQDLNGILAVGNNAGSQNITNLTNLSVSNIDTTNINLSTINNSAYPPTYSAPDLASVLSAGNYAGNQDINNVNNLNVYSINGTYYPPYPIAPYGLTQTLAYNNNASGYSMTNISNIDLFTINGSAYPPSASIPDLNNVLNQGNSAYHNIDMTNADIQNVGTITASVANITTINDFTYKAVIPYPSFNTGFITNNTYYQGGNQAYLKTGTYMITYTMAFDYNYAFGGSGNPPPYMVQGYCLLHSVSYNQDFYPTSVSNGVIPSVFISNDNGFSTYIHFTDIISVSYNDNYALGCFFNSNSGLSGSAMYLSAVLTQT